MREHIPLALPPLYAIANAGSLRDPLDFVKKLLAAGAQIVQLRAKNLSEHELGALVREAVKVRDSMAAGTHGLPRIIVNDFPHICREAGADGVHLGQGDCSPSKARALAGQRAIIGFSTNSVRQIQAADCSVLDYLAHGPVFASPTKSGHAEVVRCGGLREAVRASPLPVVAIGGITIDNVAEVFLAGANSAAVIADLERAEDLPARIRCYHTRYQRMPRL